MISIERLRQGLDLPAEQDAKLELIRGAIIATWDRLTRRKWSEYEEFSEDFDNEGDVVRELFPKGVLITEVVSATQHDLGSDPVDIDVDDLYLSQGRRVMLKSGNPFRRFVTLVYSGGYADDTVSEDILEACVLQARFALQRFNTQNIALSSQNFQGGSGSFLPADVHPRFKSLAKHNIRL